MGKVLLIILDGFGVGKKYVGNAIYLGNTSSIDYLINKYPSTLLHASEEYVGLPKGQMGNSEVGHLNIGSGRIVPQDYTRINDSIENDSFYDNAVLNETIDNAIKNNAALHILGLTSFGGVHSHMNHLLALLKLCKKRNFENVFIHAFLDGRDVSIYSGINDLKKLEEQTKILGVGKIVSVAGRYYAMDRDKRWDRVEKAYNNLVMANSLKYKTFQEGLDLSYEENITDEFVLPFQVEGFTPIKDGDSVIFFNFRADRTKELTRAFLEDNFNEFERKKLNNLYFSTMTSYGISKTNIIFPPLVIKDTLGEMISKKGLKQLRIAETEKYAHVTYFFNGGVEEAYPLEDRILIPSPKVATYDLKPEMSSFKVTEKVLEEISRNFYDLIVLNFANPDMVGHTGNLEATIKAINVIDNHVGRIVSFAQEKGYTSIITADHGNAEELEDNEGRPITSHTTNLVPFILVKEGVSLKEEIGSLKDIAPTILDLMGYEKSDLMTGRSLLKY